MEFLKAYEEAVKLGVTKEEFLPIWEMELKSKQMEEGGRAVLQRTDISHNQFLQSELSDCQGSKVRIPQQWLQVKDEVQEDLQVKLHYLFKQLTEKQELQWKQLRQKYDQLRGEICSHFEILSNHISNTNEAHTNSLKLFLMQEISLLQQDLKKVIEDKSAGQEALLISLVTPSQKQAAFKDFHDPCGGTSTSCKKNVIGDSVNLSQQDLDNNIHKSHPQKQMQQQQAQLPKPLFGRSVDEQKRKLSDKDILGSDPGRFKMQDELTGETLRNLPSTLNTKLSKVPPDLNKDHIKTPKYVAPLNTTSANVTSKIPLNKLSIDGTKVSAGDISNQTNKVVPVTSLASSSFVTKGKESDDSVDKKQVAKVNPMGFSAPINVISKTNWEMSLEHGSIKYIPTGLVTFTILNSDTFTTSHQSYMTPFYYTRSEVCRVRFCLFFNEIYQLNVNFLVSNGKFDNGDKWPISFTGAGFIYNETSQTSSKMWTLGPLKCSQPDPGEEVTFRAAVSLKTLRNTTPDVTYQTICDKGYALNNRFSFDWDLTAIEKSDM